MLYVQQMDRPLSRNPLPFVACVSSERQWEAMDTGQVVLLAKHTQNRGGGGGRECVRAGGWRNFSVIELWGHPLYETW